MVPWPRSLIPACREWKDSSLPKNLVSYRNILFIIVILLQKYKQFLKQTPRLLFISVIVIRFCVYLTIK